MLDRIANGRTDLVFEWIAGGGDPGARIDGASLIGWCAYYGDVSAIRYLLEHGVALTALGANFELNAAAFHGHWRLCEFLIEQGSDPRAALPDAGETPLHAALCSFESIEHERVIAVLIAAGADPNAKTNRGVETGAFMRDARTRGETPLTALQPMAHWPASTCWSRRALPLMPPTPMATRRSGGRVGRYATRLCCKPYASHLIASIRIHRRCAST